MPLIQSVNGVTRHRAHKQHGSDHVEHQVDQRGALGVAVMPTEARRAIQA